MAVAVSRAHRELLALEVRLLADLPLPFTAVVQAPARVGEPLGPDLGPVLLSTDRARVLAARAAGELVLAPLELEAAAYAVQEGRALRRDWLGWLARKMADPSWRLTAAEALGDVQLVERLEQARRPRRVAVAALPTGERDVLVTTPLEPRITLERFLALVGCELVWIELGGTAVEEGAAA